MHRAEKITLKFNTEKKLIFNINIFFSESNCYHCITIMYLQAKHGIHILIVVVQFDRELPT